MEKNIAVAHVFNLIHIKTSCTEKMKKTVVIASDSIIQAIDSHSLSQSVTKRIPQCCEIISWSSNIRYEGLHLSKKHRASDIAYRIIKLVKGVKGSRIEVSISSLISHGDRLSEKSKIVNIYVKKVCIAGNFPFLLHKNINISWICFRTYYIQIRMDKVFLKIIVKSLSTHVNFYSLHNGKMSLLKLKSVMGFC